MKRRNFLIIVAIIGLLASGYTAAKRYAVEVKNKAVEVVLDYEEVSQLATAGGENLSGVLTAFKSVGAISCAVTTLKMQDTIDLGLVQRTGAYTYVASNTTAAEIKEWLGEGLPELKKKILLRPLEDGKSELTIELPWAFLQTLPVGFGEAPKIVQDAGLSVIARLPNYKGASAQSVDALLRLAKKAGADTVIFDGDQALGFKGAEKDTGKAFVKNGMFFGSVEFAKQKGSEKLARAAESNVLIVHSITQAEMMNLADSTIIDRFQKAARERGVRICYVRLYQSAGDEIVRSNIQYVSAITKAITRAGFKMKPAHPLEELKVPSWVRMLSGAAVAAGIMLLVWAVVKLASNWFVMLSVLVFVVCIVGGAAGETGRALVALLAALAYPVIGLLYCTEAAVKKSNRNHLLRMISLFVGAVAISACGGLLVVGLLSDRVFMLRLNTFMGVKAAHFLPILVLTVVYLGGLGWGNDLWEEQKNRFVTRIKEIAVNPILLWQAVGVVIMMVLLGLMVARSGNDSGLQVSGFEIRFRSILDKVLYVRPRTKEFLVGYPMLICGLGFALRGKRSWAAPFLIVGCFGLVSALNTFCHIHTPILLTLLRVFNGIWIGLIIGLIAYRIIRYLPGKEDA